MTRYSKRKQCPAIHISMTFGNKQIYQKAQKMQAFILLKNFFKMIIKKIFFLQKKLVSNHNDVVATIFGEIEKG